MAHPDSAPSPKDFRPSEAQSLAKLHQEIVHAAQNADTHPLISGLLQLFERNTLSAKDAKTEVSNVITELERTNLKNLQAPDYYDEDDDPRIMQRALFVDLCRKLIEGDVSKEEMHARLLALKSLTDQQADTWRDIYIPKPDGA